MSYKGDFAAGVTIYGMFTTRRDTGLPTTLADALSGSPNSPELHIYKDGSTTQSSVGITLTVNFDNITGLNHYAIDTSQDGTFYAAGSDFTVVISRGSVNSINVQGEVVAAFSIRNRGLAVSTDITTINSKLDTIDDFLDTEIAAIKAKTDNLPSDPADASDIAASFTTVNGKLDTIDDFLDTEIAAIKAKTDNLPSDPADASDIAAEFVTVNSKLDTIDNFVDTEVAAIKAVTDKLDTMLEEDLDLTSPLTYQFTAEALSEAPTGGLTVPAIVAGVWDEPNASHATAGTTGANLSAIKAKTDNLPSDPADASDIAASFTTVNGKLDTIDDFLDTEVAAIKAKTDNLPSDPADASDIASSFSTVNTKLDAIDDFIDTEVAAIKAKTDNLPASPAATGDIPTANQNADALLARNVAGGSSTGRIVTDALRSLRNKTQIAAGTLTVYQEDDSTPAWTAVVTTTPGDPLSAIDPA